MGVADRVGSLEKGKDADLVLWTGDPLDVRNRVLRTFVSGDEVYSWDPESRQATWAARF
jgi:imidazolonepropionase-like amidohydrolase